jgi:hypothetical protein
MPNVCIQKKLLSCSHPKIEIMEILYFLKFYFDDLEIDSCYCYMYYLLAEWSERCANIPKITGSNPSGGSESTFRSDLLLTARGGSTRALIEFACLQCCPGNTLCSQRLEPPKRAGWTLYKSPIFVLIYSCPQCAHHTATARQIKQKATNR